MTTVAEFVIGGRIEPWQAIGVNFASPDRAFVGNTWLRFNAQLAPGLRSWALCAEASESREQTIDGLATNFVDQVPPAPERDVVSSVGPRLDIVGVDHVVINTPNLQRTSDAIALATGAQLKRVRDAGGGVQQGFHRLGGVVIEIVSSPKMPPGDATFWGLVLIVDNIDAVYDFVGPDVLREPKPAVQPGRRIATFRSGAQLGLPCALMTR